VDQTAGKPPSRAIIVGRLTSLDELTGMRNNNMQPLMATGLVATRHPDEDMGLTDVGGRILTFDGSICKQASGICRAQTFDGYPDVAQRCSATMNIGGCIRNGFP
jgi:hypothetical protein